MRWVDDRRFGYPTDAGTGLIGSPVAVARLQLGDDPFAVLVGDDLSFDPCASFRHRDGAGFVLYSNGLGDRGFPSYAGLDASGRPVAVTYG